MQYIMIDRKTNAKIILFHLNMVRMVSVWFQFLLLLNRWQDFVSCDFILCHTHTYTEIVSTIYFSPKVAASKAPFRFHCLLLYYYADVLHKRFVCLKRKIRYKYFYVKPIECEIQCACGSCIVFIRVIFDFYSQMCRANSLLLYISFIIMDKTMEWPPKGKKNE